MALTFDENTGLSVQDAQTVREITATNWKQAFNQGEGMPELNTSPETPAGQLVDGMTALVVEKDNEVLKFANMFNPNTAMGIWQDALAQIYFIKRHKAQGTTVTCLCRGLFGTLIPKGSIVQDANGYQYVSNNNATIGADSQASVLFTCLTKGAVILSSGGINKIVTVIPGWDSVTNPNAGVTGRLEETQAEFENRRYNSVALNSHGLASSVEGTLADYDDVIACRVEQNRSDENITTLGVTIPPHSIYLSVYGGTSEEIGNTIHNKLDAGCGTAGNTTVDVTDPTTESLNRYYYTVPATKPLYIKVTFDAGTVYNASMIQQALLDNFNGLTRDYFLAKMGDTLFASRFYQSVIDTGISTLSNIELSRNGSTWSDTVTYNLNEMPTLSATDISFVVGG